LFANTQCLSSNIDELISSYARGWILVKDHALNAVGYCPEEISKAADNNFEPVEDIILLVPKKIPRPI
jgi:hypothetical protein